MYQSARRINMPMLRPIVIRQPQANDIVSDPIIVCGITTGYDGDVEGFSWATVYDGNGTVLTVYDGDGTEHTEFPIYAGNPITWTNFAIEMSMRGEPPSTPQGKLEVYQRSETDGSRINIVPVPIFFGTALINIGNSSAQLNVYYGFEQYTVQHGDSLSAIAKQFYGRVDLWDRIFQANRDQISDPNLIYPDQV